MPIWSEILAELQTTVRKDGPPDFDSVRRKYLAKLNLHSSRNTVLYATAWLQKPEAPPPSLSIGDEDVQALMEVTQGLEGTELDLILHSPGGSPEAAEAIVSYVRSRFSEFRVLVPNLAMSAATMIACAADEVVLGKHSFLGPTDPQLPLATPLGLRLVPAHAVLTQFRRAQEESTDAAKLAAWLPMLGQYGPDVLVRCELARELSKVLVATWLENYMLVRVEGAREKAESISAWLADHDVFKSHARHLSRDTLRDHGLVIRDLESDETLQDLSLSVFHATTHTFSGTPAVKIVENHHGRAFVKHQVIRPPPPGPQPPPTS